MFSFPFLSYLLLAKRFFCPLNAQVHKQVQNISIWIEAKFRAPCLVWKMVPMSLGNPETPPALLWTWLLPS
jgi:hypothetical protein